MATFPTSADFKRRTPRPAEGVPSRDAGFRTAAAAPISTAGAEAQFAQGRQTQQTGDLIGKLAIQLDETAAQDALNQLRTKRQELTYDPEKGFRRFKGGDALKPGPGGKPLLDELPDGFQREAEALSSKLFSPRAKGMFDRAAATEGRLYKRDMATYFGEQTDLYNAAVYKETQAGALTEAAQVFDDPAKLENVATRAQLAAEKRAADLGIPGEQAGISARSSVYKVGVENLLASNPRAALGLYDKVKDRLDAADATALATKLKSTAIDVEADDVIAGYSGQPLPQAALQYQPLVQQAATKHGVPVPLAMGVLAQESKGNKTAVGPVTRFGTAKGLMQLIDGTAKEMGVTDVFDPEQNVNGGVGYLKKMLAKYNGNERLALMGYNWGPGNVDKWLKAGANPDLIPAETRDYINKVQGYAATIGGRSDVKTAQIDILQRPDRSPEVKAAAYAKIEKQSKVFEAYKTAEIKTLQDNARAVLSAVILDPSSYKDGTLLNYAERFDALGEREEAVRFRILAAQEGTLKTYMTSPPSAQKEMVSQILKGLPKEIAEGILKGDTKGRAEAKAKGAEAFGVLQDAFKGNVDLPGLEKQAKTAIEHFTAAGDAEGARKVAEFFDTAWKTNTVLQQDPVAAQRTSDELKARADSGQATQRDLQLLATIGDAIPRQQAAFNKDAYKAGTDLYENVGRAIPVNWGEAPDAVAATLRLKAKQAEQIDAFRGTTGTLPFSQEEIQSIRTQLDAAPPDRQAQIMATLGAVGDEMIPRVAAALAGKSDTGDPLSRSYAAALSMFAEKDPARAQVADQILRGARLIKDGGEAGRKPAVTSDAWQTELQDRIGNAFTDLGARVPAVIADSIASVYVYQMFRAGKQGEKTDLEVLDKAIDAVVGRTMTRNGQTLLPPRGVDTYQFDGALKTLTDGDVAGLKTLEGDPITPDVIYRRGVLSNVGDGLYKVRIPDPRRGGDLSEVQAPDGRAWILDIRPLLQRPSAQTPGTFAEPTPADAAARARRQAPAQPVQ